MKHLALCLLLSGSLTLADEKPVALLDGQSLSGWVDDKGQPAKLGTGWAYDADGSLHLTAGSKAGNLMTERLYASFILEWEWKVAPGGNNGVKYRVMKYEKGGWLGPEYQMIDDHAHPDGKIGGSHSTAAVYLIYAPAPDKPLNPPGQWNKSKVVLRGNHVEHWLNGKLVCQGEIGSEDWRSRVARTKFKSAPGFGENPAGRIMITYHNDETWYRSMTIQELK
jgi:hypothetical protein